MNIFLSFIYNARLLLCGKNDPKGALHTFYAGGFGLTDMGTCAAPLRSPSLRSIRDIPHASALLTCHAADWTRGQVAFAATPDTNSRALPVLVCIRRSTPSSLACLSFALLTYPAGRPRRAAPCPPGTPEKRRRRWRCGSSCRHSPAAAPRPRCRRRR